MEENNCKSDEGLISKIYKNLIQLNNKKKMKLNLGRGPEQTFFQRRYMNGKMVLNVNNYKGNSNQNKMRYHFMPVRMAIIKNTQ